MLPGNLEDWLNREWLLTNGRGGYASSTLINCPTRRHHGWLVWNRPGGPDRWMIWSHAAEHVIVGGRTFLLSNFEFNNAIDPHGYQHLELVEVHHEAPSPAVVWIYRLAGADVTRTLWLDEGHDRVTLRYDVHARQETGVKLQVWPLVACREMHALRRKSASEFYDKAWKPDGFVLEHLLDRTVCCCFAGHVHGEQATVDFLPRPDWWFNFRYRQEAARGLECGEDLFVPGSFVAQSEQHLVLQIVAEAGHTDYRRAAAHCERMHRPPLSIPVALCDAPTLFRRALTQCVVHQPMPDAPGPDLILAGYPWLDGYSRDACVAIPGLMLSGCDVEVIGRVLIRMADLLRGGLLPNHVINDAEEYEYTAADEPLWFIHAVDAFLAHVGPDHATAARLLHGSCTILDAYAVGTGPARKSGPTVWIGVDPADGLVSCSGMNAACTWMDARYDGRWITPRNGKPVEVNALWHHALRSVARLIRETDGAAAMRYEQMAERVRRSFASAFWLADVGYLADVVTANGADRSLRPNQILAMSLAHSPLDRQPAERALEVITQRLLTPYGLRTLDRDHPDYHGRYEGAPEQREKAAHQGCVYPWLMGAYVEALLRVRGDTPENRAAARELLRPLIDHARMDAGLGGVSELFDGDPPHAPRGCINQAWSAAELLRAWHLTEPRLASKPSDAARLDRESGAKAPTVAAPRP